MDDFQHLLDNTLKDALASVGGPKKPTKDPKHTGRNRAGKIKNKKQMIKKSRRKNRKK